MQAAPVKGAAGEQINRDERSDHTAQAQPRQYPDNLRAFGILLDRRNAFEPLAEPLELVQNADAIGVLRTFRDSPRIQFAVLAGELHIRSGGFVGGFATDWPSALRLFAYSSDRIGQEAQRQGLSICSAWILLVNERRASEVRELIATAQPVAGSA